MPLRLYSKIIIMLIYFKVKILLILLYLLFFLIKRALRCINLGRFTVSGRVAEWPNASVLKTEDLQGSGGSNPSSSVLHIPFHNIFSTTVINRLLWYEIFLFLWFFSHNAQIMHSNPQQLCKKVYYGKNQSDQRTRHPNH